LNTRGFTNKIDAGFLEKFGLLHVISSSLIKGLYYKLLQCERQVDVPGNILAMHVKKKNIFFISVT